MFQCLSDELQEVVKQRQNFLDRALGRLQFQRELSRLQLFHTQVVIFGSIIQKEIPKTASWDREGPSTKLGSVSS